MVRDNRIGTVEVSGTLVHNDDVDVNGLLLLFGRLIVLRCEHMFYRDVFKIEAYSPDFDIAPEGIIPPMYKAIICTDEEGMPNDIAFEKVQ